MRILALNCGSSSVKCALIESVDGQRYLDARIENIGTDGCELHVAGHRRVVGAIDYAAALEALLQGLRAAGEPPPQIDAVAHRLVHGGDQFVGPTLVDDAAVERIAALSDLAPLHNPPALAALRLARLVLADIPHVAVFDTAFHAHLPPEAREYAMPGDVRRRHGIRRYGFHGISHEYVMRCVAEHLRTRPDALRIVSCHLGAGSSVAAIRSGRSIDTSMGMTPLEGLVMATRAGDLDAGVVLRLLRRGLAADQLDDLLNRRSGLLGLTGTSDMRAVERRAGEGDEACRLALSLYAYRVRKYIGAYAAALGGAEVIAFTAGIGENSVAVRALCSERLEFLGAKLDAERNRDVKLTPTAPVADISATRSRVRLLVVRADEERAMASQVATLLEASRTSEAFE